MQTSGHFERVIGNRHYSTENATLLATYWSNSELSQQAASCRPYRNLFLYRDRSWAHFVVTLTEWPLEENTLDPVDKKLADFLYQQYRPVYATISIAGGDLPLAVVVGSVD